MLWNLGRRREELLLNTLRYRQIPGEELECEDLISQRGQLFGGKASSLRNNLIRGYGWLMVMTIRSSIRNTIIIHLLLLLLLPQLLLELSLLLKHLLTLNSTQEVMSLEIFGIIMTNPLFLHFSVFLYTYNVSFSFK